MNPEIQHPTCDAEAAGGGAGGDGAITRGDAEERRIAGRARRRRKRRLSLVASGFALLALAQTNTATKVRDFSVPEYYDPPHETQMKTLLQGAEAEQIAGGRIRISNLKLQTFAQDGRPQMVVEAPHCVFDSLRRSVSSPGPLSVQSADGKLTLKGEGFFWQQTNSTLVISNRVRTVIRNTPGKDADS